MIDTIPIAPLPLYEIRLPTRHLLDKARAAYDEGQDVLWRGKSSELRKGIKALGGWRPAHMGEYADAENGRRRIVRLMHDGSAPVAYFNTPPSWLRVCRICGWTDEAWAWEETDEQVAHEQAGAFACGATGCVSRVHEWTESRR